MDKTRENTYVMALTITASVSAILYLVFDRMIGGMIGLEGWPVVVADVFLVIFTVCLLIGAISSICTLVKSKGQDTGALSASVVLSVSTIAFIFLSCLRILALL